MILKLLEEYGELSTVQLAQILDRPVREVEKEVVKLSQQGKICTENGKHYITPKTSFPGMLFAAFLIFVCSFILVGAIKATF